MFLSEGNDRQNAGLEAKVEDARITRDSRCDALMAVYSTLGGVSEAGWSPNFERLVLGCMDSYDSEKRCILQHFSKSTRFASFCTFLISEILQICVKILLIFAEISQKISKNLQFRRENPKKIRKFSRKNLRKICKF